jgi:hypothetical protein
VKIIVNDANILIDLVKLDLLGPFFSLPFELHTTNLVLEELFEEQLNSFEPYIADHSFFVAEFSEQEMIEITSLTRKFPTLSSQDCSAFYHARKTGGSLITGDNSLRRFTRQQEVEVFGHLWVLDMLVETGLIMGNKAIEILERLTREINPRLGLPKEECHKRIQYWRSLQVNHTHLSK